MGVLRQLQLVMGEGSNRATRRWLCRETVHNAAPPLPPPMAGLPPASTLGRPMPAPPPAPAVHSFPATDIARQWTNADRPPPHGQHVWRGTGRSNRPARQ